MLFRLVLCTYILIGSEDIQWEVRTRKKTAPGGANGKREEKWAGVVRHQSELSAHDVICDVTARRYEVCDRASNDVI